MGPFVLTHREVLGSTPLAPLQLPGSLPVGDPRGLGQPLPAGGHSQAILEEAGGPPAPGLET